MAKPGRTTPAAEVPGRRLMTVVPLAPWVVRSAGRLRSVLRRGRGRRGGVHPRLATTAGRADSRCGSRAVGRFVALVDQLGHGGATSASGPAAASVRALPDDLVDQRETVGGGAVVVDYAWHGRALATGLGEDGVTRWCGQRSGGGADAVVDAVSGRRANCRPASRAHVPRPPCTCALHLPRGTTRQRRSCARRIRRPTGPPGRSSPHLQTRRQRPRHGGPPQFARAPGNKLAPGPGRVLREPSRRTAATGSTVIVVHLRGAVRARSAVTESLIHGWS